MDDTLRPDPIAAATSLLAGGAAVVGSYAAAGFTPEFVAAPVSSTITVLAPGPLVAASIQLLGSLGQSLVFAGALAATVALFGAVAGVARIGATAAARAAKLPGDGAGARLLWTAGTLVGGAGLAVALTGAVVPALTAGAAAAAVVGLAALRPAGVEPTSLARRRLLRAGAGAASVAAAGWVVRAGADDGDADRGAATGDDAEVTASQGAATATPGDVATDGDAADDGEGTPGEDDPTATPEPSAVERLFAAAGERSLDVAGIDSLVTESRGFYQVDINSVDPDLTAAEWSLSVTGAVDEERTVDFETLTGLPAERRFVTLQCVGDSRNGKKIDTALWTGVPAAELLGDLPEECCVMLRAADGYYNEFPLTALDDALFAYRMNGEPLPRGHGYPVRALIPGHWGEINVKWLTEIEVLTREKQGYWEKRGWHGTGPVNTVSKLHAVNRLDDDRIQIGGHAYAGTRGIDRVEVSVDGGSTWTDATLSEPLPGRQDVDADGQPSGAATDAWRMWEHVYDPDGGHEVVVRATDGNGDLQTEEEQSAYPRGATGWVSKRVSP